MEEREVMMVMQSWRSWWGVDGGGGGENRKKSESESHSVGRTLCDPMDYTLHGILQAGILEWADFLFCRGSSQSRDGTQVSRIEGGFFTS